MPCVGRSPRAARAGADVGGLGGVAKPAGSRTSISKAIRMKASASCGLADWTCGRPNHSRSCRSSLRLGARYAALRPSPQRATTFSSVMYSSNSARVDSPHGQSSVVSSFTSAPQSTSARVRSGYVAANRIESGPPSDTPMSAAVSEPAASMTARTSSIRSSSVPTRTRSDRPIPRLSKRISPGKRSEPFAEATVLGAPPTEQRGS